jgi:MFS family permease
MTQTTPAQPKSDTKSGFNRKLISPMILGSILNPINSSMISVALVPIGVTFHALPAQTAWLVSALYLATATGQPVVGRLVDRYGPRPLYLVASVLVGIAGVMGWLAPDLGWLIASRVLLGLGTCAGYPSAMYLIRSEAKRTGVDSPQGVLTALAVAAQTVVVVGPTIGGLLIALGGWRSIFAANIPIAIACLWLAYRRLPRSVPEVKDRMPLDFLGIGLFAAMLTSLMLYLMSPGVRDLWLVALMVALGAAFVLRERRAVDPFLDLRVFGGNMPLILTYVRTLLAQTVAYAFLYGYTQWLEEGHGFSAVGAGLVQLPMSAVAIGVSTLTGRRKEFKAKLMVGAISQIVVCALLLFVNGHSGIWLLVGVALILGLPQGLNSLANQNAVYYQAHPDRMGASAGLLRTFVYLGAMISSAATGITFKHGAGTPGLHSLAYFLIVVAAISLAVILADRSLGKVGKKTPTPEGTSA